MNQLLKKWGLFVLSLCVCTQILAKPKVAIVIDDLGNHWQKGQTLISHPLIQTVAIMPQRPYTVALSKQAWHAKKQVLVHMPMDNGGNVGLGNLGLYIEDDALHIMASLELAFAENPYASGLNNHTGSLFTSTPEVMKWVLDYLKLNNKFFLDSRTSASSVGIKLAKLKQVPHMSRHFFLDNQTDIAYLQQQWQKTLNFADKHGQAILIAHPYQQSIDFFSQLQLTPLLRQYDFVKVSSLIQP